MEPSPPTSNSYSDFMCPACKHVHEAVLPAIVMDYVNSGKAYLIFREFPLNIPAHVYSRSAAAFAVAAARIGKYQTVSDALFRNQQAWGTTGKVWDTVAGGLPPRNKRRSRRWPKTPRCWPKCSATWIGTRSMLNQTPTLMITYKLKQQPWTQFADYSLFRGYIHGLLKK